MTKLSRGISIAEASKNGKGEDAMFIQDRDIGVFDGVGGWKDYGVDPGIYSRQLSNGISEFITSARAAQAGDGLVEGVDLAKALDFGAGLCKSKKLTGSSTACIATLDEKNGELHCLNIGDSGLVMFRRNPEGKVVVTQKSKIGQVGFNCPYQIENIGDPKFGKPSWNTTSKDATLEVFSLRSGDVSVMASDGVWDNLFDDDICKILEQSSLLRDRSHETNLDKVTEEDVDDVVEEILSHALKKSVSKKDRTPWSVSVERYYRQRYLGGKPDDMTVIVSYFSEHSCQI